MAKYKTLIESLLLYSILGLNTLNDVGPPEKINKLERISLSSLSEKKAIKGFESGTKIYKNQEIHYAIIDPKEYNFEIRIKKEGMSLRDAKKSNPYACTNGSFFKKNFEPIGLLISKNKTIHPKLSSKYWGIFSIDKNNKGSLKYSNKFDSKSNKNFAIEGYPVLIYKDNLKIKKKGKKAPRTAIGINKEKKIVLISTEQGYFSKGISLKELGKLMKTSEKEGGFECYYALNLDGGPSSKIYIKDELEESLFGAVSNYIVIFKKTNKK